MRIFEWVFAMTLLSLAAIAAIGMMLPRDVLVSRSVVIDAPASAVWPFIADLRRGKDWSPWLNKEKATHVRFSQPSRGVGATVEWQSDEVGDDGGRMRIVRSDHGERLTSAFEIADLGPAVSTWDLKEIGGRTTVTWVLMSEVGPGPMERWKGLMIDGRFGSEYERGLDALKQLVEE